MASRLFPSFLYSLGLPSKLKALGVTRGTRPLLERSTPVMTIPIDFSRRTTQSRGSSFLPATIPTTIALSADGDLGLAYTEIRSVSEKITVSNIYLSTCPHSNSCRLIIVSSHTES